MSDLLFILVVEILSVKIKQAENFDEIRVFDNVSHLIQSANDTTLTLADEQSITKCHEAVK